MVLTKFIHKSWPLAKALLKWALQLRGNESQLHDKDFFVYFDLFCLEKIRLNESLFQLSPVVLSAAAMKAFELGKSGKTVCALYKRLKSFRCEVEKKLMQTVEKEAESFIFRSDLCFDKIKESVESLQIIGVPKIDIVDVMDSLKAIKCRALKNIGWLPTIDFSRLIEIKDMKQWIDSSKSAMGSKILCKIHIMRTIEGFLWQHILIGKGFNGTCRSTEDIDGLMIIFDEYRQNAHHVFSSNEKHGLMMVKEQSREVLVCWVTYCLVFDAFQNYLYPVSD